MASPWTGAEGLGNIESRFAEQFKQLRQRFLDGLFERWQRICQASHSQDFPALHLELHRLSGSASSYGIDALGHQARAAEALALAGASDELQKALAALQITLEQACAPSDAKNPHIQT